MMIFSFLAGLFVMFTVLALYIFAIAFIIWMSIDAGKQDKFWWLVLIVGLPLVGAVVYFFVEKKGDYFKIKPIHREHKND